MPSRPETTHAMRETARSMPPGIVVGRDFHNHRTTPRGML
jgi:hypothetical protein